MPLPLARSIILRPALARSAGHPVRHATFGPTPSPPRLPKEEQEIFEALQKQSTGAFSQPRDAGTAGQDTTAAGDGTVATEAQTQEQLQHPNLRRGAPPEFEGDRNPKTGEVGGPKNEPLRWGAKSDWSFNGRVTDF